MKGYLLLAIAIIAEVFGVTMMKLSQGFTVLFPSVGVIAGYLLSFYLFSLALKTIPLSFAYAIWSGSGTAFSALLGVWIWGEAFTMLTFSGITLIIGGIVLLNMSGHRGTAKEVSS
ncbi:DMT family transporter [Thalassobacillus sp. B23F22_16]|uniref:DMT family transporter n=1 Tax=Thalassobacillus sp. B23F22_16 TaxID=3459513 RepID=UPI00373E454D